MRLKATVEKKGVGTCRRQRRNGSDWGGCEMRQKTSGLAPFLSPCFPEPCLWGCLGLKCQQSPPFCMGQRPFLLNCSANVWQSRQGAEDCRLRFITHGGDRRMPRDALERNRVTSFRFFCLVYVQISSLIKSANALLKSFACKCFFLRLATQSCVFLSYITALSVLLSYCRAISVGGRERLCLNL